eukprot:Gregarina_sp_Poly_1__8905@NODE_538_length_7624_cov_89_908694_g425_i0_p10_GENE_NODE_538_length_7624_cov_89_908694_g425_i0NODE_538_length_7624_cov_89_908694_g425_i0_p10_ORF_typecomplete_len113_score2_72DUF4736/PF15883_5/0_035S1FA/PF04689_13/0_14_NODE_538_length_7624_cov_89_908694_g425_i064206758
MCSNSLSARVAARICSIDQWAPAQGLNFLSIQDVNSKLCARLGAFKSQSLVILLIVGTAIFSFLTGILFAVLCATSSQLRNAKFCRQASVFFFRARHRVFIWRATGVRLVRE